MSIFDKVFGAVILAVLDNPIAALIVIGCVLGVLLILLLAGRSPKPDFGSSEWKAEAGKYADSYSGSYYHKGR